MHESQILDMINSISNNQLSDAEKSIILADVKSELNNLRLAGNPMNTILSKINDLSNGLYKESQAISTYFQDFSEQEQAEKPFEIKNKDEIDKFLKKMMSEDFEGNVFGDTWEFYHPTENMNADGVPRHRSDFVTKNSC